MENVECDTLKDCLFFRLKGNCMVELCLCKSKEEWSKCAIVISVHGDKPVVIPIKEDKRTDDEGKALFCALESSVLDAADTPVYKQNLTFVGQDVNSMSAKMKATVQNLINLK